MSRGSFDGPRDSAAWAAAGAAAGAAGASGGGGGGYCGAVEEEGSG